MVTKIVAGVIAAVALTGVGYVGAVGGFDRPDCCAPGADCCYPGSVCCVAGPQACCDSAEAKTVKTHKGVCCEVGADCCVPGAGCCDKTRLSTTALAKKPTASTA